MRRKVKVGVVGGEGKNATREDDQSYRSPLSSSSKGFLFFCFVDVFLKNLLFQTLSSNHLSCLVVELCVNLYTIAKCLGRFAELNNSRQQIVHCINYRKQGSEVVP